MRQENLIKMLTALHNENKIMLNLMSTFYDSENKKLILSMVDECENLFSEGVIGELPNTPKS